MRGAEDLALLLRRALADARVRELVQRIFERPVPLFRRKLDQADVPHLKIEFEEKMWTFEAARTEVETFSESMLFD